MIRKNPVRIPEKVLTWRESKRKGSIMWPKTFKAIKRKAARGGYAIPSAVGGKAYWITVLNKYLDEHPGDKTAMRTLRQLLKGRRRGPIRRNPTIEYPSSFRKLKLKIKRNPVKKWYVGYRTKGGRPKIFSSGVTPTRRIYPRFKYVIGPFGSKTEVSNHVKYVGFTY